MEYLEEISDLADAMAMVAADEHIRANDENAKKFRKVLPMIRVRLEEWMSENEWWKDAAKLDSAYHEDNATDAGVPIIFKTVVLKDYATEEERNEFGSDVIALSPSGHADLLHYQPPPDSCPFDKNFSIVTSVNGTPYPSFEQVKNILLEEGSDKRMQMVHSVFAEIFLNPAFIIDLGLLDVLKFQIEELKLDVNYQCCAGILFRVNQENELQDELEDGLEDELHEGMPLLAHALVQPDQRLLDYLLSLKRIEANPLLDHSLNGSDVRDWEWTLLHDLPLLASYRFLHEGIDLMSRIRRILEREEVDVNCHNHHDETPLEEVCDFLWVTAPRMHYSLARLFLCFGAQVTEQALSHLHEASESHSRRKMDLDNKDEDVGSYAESAECCRELIEVLTATREEREAEDR